MRTHSSRSHRSKEPRVTFAMPDESYELHNFQENIHPNQGFSYDSHKPKKSSTTSLSSKFSKRWERAPTEESTPYNYQPLKETYTPKISKEITEDSLDFDSPITQKTYKYDNISEIENLDDQDISDDLPRAIMMNRNPTNQSAETILQNINVLVNRVHEICNKKK